MPSMTFRFTTECELTIDGSSYEEAYLKFKDLCHGDAKITDQPLLKVFPPENSTVYFEIDEQSDFTQIDALKGDFKQDILNNLPANWVERIQSHSPPLH